MFWQCKILETLCTIAILILRVPIFEIEVTYTFNKYEISFAFKILLQVLFKIKITFWIAKVGCKTILLD